MCVILSLSPGASIDYKKLETAIFNNLDGFGLVNVDTEAQLMEIRRGFNPEGTDPEVVARLLEDNKDVTRHLHLRNTTKGISSYENLHPFEVFHSGNRTVLLLHNGTLGVDYHPKVGDDRSDTQIFSTDFLTPLLARFKGEYGEGDYNDPIFKAILHKFVLGNRVMLVANDLDPLRVGIWPTIKNTDGSEFIASNNDYFFSVVRGKHKPVPVPFQSSNNRWTPTNSPSGATTGETTGINPQGGDNVVPINKDASDVPFQVDEEGEKKAENSGTEPKEVQTLAITKLSELDLDDKEPYVPSQRFLQALGAGNSKLFEDYGFDSLTWISDEELVAGLRTLNPEEFGELFRALVEASSGAFEDLDVAEQLIERYKTTIEVLQTEVAILKLENDAVQEAEEANRSLKLDNKVLLAENKGLLSRLRAAEEELLSLRGMELKNVA